MDLLDKFIISNVTIIDGNGKEPEKNKAITVESGIIKQIEDINNIKLEKDIQVIDFNGMCIMPGLIDAHIHFCGVEDLTPLTILSQNIIQSAYRGLTQAQTTLKSGFTAVRDLSRCGLYLKRAISQGLLIGPRIVSTGLGLSPTGGACDLSIMPPEIKNLLQSHSSWGLTVDGEVEIRKAIRTLLREGADQIKFFANGSDGSPIDSGVFKQFTKNEMKVIIEESRRVPGTKVMAHICQSDTAWDCMEIGVDTFEHMRYMSEELADAMVEKGKFWVPTAAFEFDFYDVCSTNESSEMLSRYSGPFYHRDITEPYADPNYRQNLIEKFQIAYEKGVKIAIGSDSYDEIHTPYGEYSIKELKTFINLGMTPLEVIKSATKVGAQVLGLENQIGTIEVGKIADLLIVDGDPSIDIEVLANSSNIKYIIQNGKITVDHGRIII